MNRGRQELVDDEMICTVTVHGYFALVLILGIIAAL
jgi:hypothetical protein